MLLFSLSFLKEYMVSDTYFIFSFKHISLDNLKHISVCPSTFDNKSKSTLHFAQKVIYIVQMYHTF